jgi:5-methyltetrahydropteroyltriglutamate--homocysteine methyltransferase
MRTSHVGSFPLTYSRENIARVLRDLHSIGLDVPPYPQLRSFIDIYLKPLEDLGIVYSRRGFYFSTPRSLEVSPPRIRVEDAELAVEVVSRERLAFKGLRGPITGVFTLASRLYLDEDVSKGLQATALAHRDVVESFFKEFVAGIARYMRSLGYTVIFFDEPSLTLFIGRRVLYGWSEESVIEVLSHVTKAAGDADVGVHVCGQVNPKIIEILARADKVKYLNFEFYSTPTNIELINREVLEKYDKFIAPGVASTKSVNVESIDEILTLLRKVYEKAGGRIDLVSADCGFGGLRGALGNEEQEYRVSIEKLKNIVEAVKIFGR